MHINLLITISSEWHAWIPSTSKTNKNRSCNAWSSTKSSYLSFENSVVCQSSSLSFLLSACTFIAGVHFRLPCYLFHCVNVFPLLFFLFIHSFFPFASIVLHFSNHSCSSFLVCRSAFCFSLLSLFSSCYSLSVSFSFPVLRVSSLFCFSFLFFQYPFRFHLLFYICSIYYSVCLISPLCPVCPSPLMPSHF